MFTPAQWITIRKTWSVNREHILSSGKSKFSYIFRLFLQCISSDRYDITEISDRYDITEISDRYDITEISDRYDLTEISDRYDITEISDRYDITKILLKVALDTIKQTNKHQCVLLCTEYTGNKWKIYLGESKINLTKGDTCLHVMITSFVKHRSLGSLFIPTFFDFHIVLM